MTNTCQSILEHAYHEAAQDLTLFRIKKTALLEKVEYICRCQSNRAAVRLLMACLLAKLEHPEFDPRKPYTEIGTDDAFSGRTYDEHYLTAFIMQHHLPCNITTAFLTPALRNMNQPLTPDVELVGRPREVYQYTLELLDLAAKGKLNPQALLIDTIRYLVMVRNEHEQRIKTLLSGLELSDRSFVLSSEAIVRLLQQHLACKNVSRLPVLIVAAALTVAEKYLKERVKALYAHTAADKQTGSLGDVEIMLEDDDHIITCYEMKLKAITINDIRTAIEKFRHVPHLDNYIFITTDAIDEGVRAYANAIYDECGIEVAILDCLGFIRHFLHLFHRIRVEFLEEYQRLVLQEPESAVSQPLKEALLALRRAAEE
jgi:hypothetical protein